MALKVKEIPNLIEKDKISLVAGKGGLEHSVCSVGIADYEFLDEFDYTAEDEFESNCFVVSSLLFAQGHPEKILEALKRLCHSKVSGLAFKKSFFRNCCQKQSLLPTRIIFPFSLTIKKFIPRISSSGLQKLCQRTTTCCCQRII